jgi:hypoxanthine phosphoribosyltransferase
MGAMSEGSYDYSKRRGVRPIAWEDFHGLCRALATAVLVFDPHIILAVGRGGYYPGTLLAHILQVDIYPVLLTRRVHDVPTYATPRWILNVPAEVKNRRVLVVDEISSTGETLSVVKQRCVELGVLTVRTAVLYAHSGGSKLPDYIGLISDELLINPWDREILTAHGFQLHPEYAGALAQQGLNATSDLLVTTTPYTLAKGQR